MSLVTLKFHPNIQKYTNGVAQHTVEVKDLVDVRSALETLFPTLGFHMRRIRSGANKIENIALVGKNRRILQRDDYNLNYLKKDDTELSVVPLFIGGGKAGKLIIGAALIAIAIWQPQFLFGASGVLSPGGALGFLELTQGSFYLAGISLIFSGILGYIMKPSKPDFQGQQTSDTEARRDNKIFSGLTNTITSNTPIPMVYGRTRVGGQFISGEIRSFQHGRNESVRVSDSFPVGAT